MLDLEFCIKGTRKTCCFTAHQDEQWGCSEVEGGFCFAFFQFIKRTSCKSSPEWTSPHSYRPRSRTKIIPRLCDKPSSAVLPSRQKAMNNECMFSWILSSDQRGFNSCLSCPYPLPRNTGIPLGPKFIWRPSFNVSLAFSSTPCGEILQC